MTQAEQQRPARIRRVAALLGLVVLAGAVLGLRPFAANRLRHAFLDKLTARFGAAKLGEEAELTWSGRFTTGPLELENGAIHVDTIEVQLPLEWRCVLGDCKPKEISISGARIDAGEDGEVVRRLLAKKGDGSSEKSGNREIRIESAAVSVTHHQRRLALDGLTGRLVQANGLWSFVVSSAALGEVRVTGDGPRQLTAELVNVPLASLVGAVPSFAGTSGKLAGNVHADFSEHTLSVDLDARELAIQSRRLGPAPIGPMRVRVGGRVNVAETAISTDDLTIRLGEGDDVPVHVSVALEKHEAWSFRIDAKVQAVSYAAIVKAMPPALAPGEVADGVDGPLNASLHLEGTKGARDTWKIVPKLDLAALRKAARQTKSPWMSTFVHHPLLSDNTRGRAIVVGPENPDFTPFSSIPQVLVAAVLTSEDAGFFGHPGFDFDSLAENLLASHEQGEVLRGGSSISQQLAKNLFYSREKTFTRKLKEALGTIALEAALPKERMLEIYLNTIEWGPDIYGIGEAARHYFDKTPAELTPAEAAFLAIIIPNPVKYHASCSRGEATDFAVTEMSRLLGKLHDAGVLSDAQYAEATSEQLVFHHR